MPSAFQYQNIARWGIIGTVCASAILAVYYSHVFKHGATYSRCSPSLAEAGTGGVPVSASRTKLIWQSFQSRAVKQAGSPNVLPPLENYRLAGTFFLEGTGESQRRAIIDDIAKRSQTILGEGEALDDATVERIFRDHVVLRTLSGTRELWVDFVINSRVGSSVLATNVVTAQSGNTNRFGCVQVQDNRWRFSRKPILDYYQELLDEPDRMVAVFDTMKPVRDEQNKITGYVVGIEGEKDFFDAMGLRQGDIVRAVNSFPMTNRRRAEAFIDQFLKNQLNAVVLDVERGGQTVKQVYQIQP